MIWKHRASADRRARLLLSSVLAALMFWAGTPHADESTEPAGTTDEPPASEAIASRVVTGGEYTVYRPEFFAASRPATALDMVQLIPGFSIQGGSFGRGLEGSRTNVLIDGQQLPGKGESVSSVLQRIPAGTVVSIVRIRGTVAGIDSAGFPEVLSINRYPRTDTSGTLTLSAGESDQVDTRGFDLTGTHGRPGRVFSGTANLNRADSGSSSSFTPQGGAQEAVRRTEQTRGGSASTSVDLELRRVRWRSDIRYSESTFDSTERRFLADTQTLDLLSSAESEQNRLTTRLEAPLPRDLTATLNVAYSNSDSASLSRAVGEGMSSNFSSSRDSDEAAAALSLRRAAEGPWQQEGGVDFAINRLASLSEFGSGGMPVPLPQSDILVTERRYGAFYELGWSPEGRWTYRARLRANFAEITGERALDDRRSFTDVKPELSAQGRLGQQWRVELRAAREVDQLAFGAFTASAALADDLVTLGNPQIDPERRWLMESTLRRSVPGRGEVSLTLRAERIDNPTELVRTASGFDARDNIDSATAARLSVQAALPLDTFGVTGARVDVSLSTGTSRVSDPTTGESRPLSGDRLWDWNLSARRDLQGLPLSFGVSASDSRSRESYRPAETSGFDTSPRFSAFAEYHLSRKISLRADMNYNGSARSERTLYDGVRGGSAVLERQIERYPSAKDILLTLRVEL